MLQVARLAPTLLQSSAISSAPSSASATTRTAASATAPASPDLYYTVFGLEGLVALRAPIAPDRTRAYLTGVRRRRGARLRPSELPGALLGQPARRRAAGRRAAAHARAPRDVPRADGGFATDPDGDEGSAYGAFVALGAYQDLRAPVPDSDALMAQLAVAGGGRRRLEQRRPARRSG